MKRIVQLGPLWAAVWALLWGCNSPCTDLAERTCKRAGEADPLCQRLRKVAAQPSAQDNEACRAGHAFIDEMEKR